MDDEFDDPEFDRLAASVLEANPKAFPDQPVPQKHARPGFNAILVNSRQKGNPLLNNVKNVPWEYGDIQPDFVVGATTCAMFLSLKYHRLHPEYIYNRIRDLGKQYGLRIMLVLCDIDNHSDALRELTKTCVVNSFALILAWTAAEAGRYLETFKSLETAPAKEIKGQISTSYSDQLTDVLTSIRSVNKTDAYNLVGTYGSLKKAFDATPEELTQIAGWGPQKIKNYTNSINLPFTVKNGTSRERQEQVLRQATQVKHSDFNGDFGPGADHSASRATVQRIAEATGVDSDANVDHSIADDLVTNTEVANPAGSATTTAVDSSRNSGTSEYQGTLEILKRMREASGYTNT